MTKPSQSLPNGESTTAEAAKLTRRRRTMKRAKSSAAAATAKLANLEAGLDSLTSQRRQQKAARQEAKSRYDTLKKAINASDEQRTKLRAATKDARKAVAKAQRKAHEAEAKYDRAVLADLVRREKQSDLSTHPRSGAAAGTYAALEQPPGTAIAAIAPGPEGVRAEPSARDFEKR